MLVIIIWYFFIIIFGLGLVVLASASKLWPWPHNSGLGLKVLASFNITGRTYISPDMSLAAGPIYHSNGPDMA